MLGATTRRTFLKRMMASSTLLGAMPGTRPDKRLTLQTAKLPQIKQYKRLGRTDIEFSDISFGASRLRDDGDLIQHALARGINYFDTAESYTGGRSETTICKVL